ncbi:hypothetical protein AOX55_00006676 (plasmid) [Sinorhizobium fredii CCBAU 25509]|nr:hypothetical protein AOX55_00006676 [Sinorhizobium fredii CCBAU 25509]
MFGAHHPGSDYANRDAHCPPIRTELRIKAAEFSQLVVIFASLSLLKT